MAIPSMSDQPAYHVYDIVLPTLFDKARAVYNDYGNLIREDIRHSQLRNIDVLKEALLDELERVKWADGLPIMLLPPDSDFYAHLLALRLGIDLPAKTAFILDYHSNHFIGNSYYTKEQFSHMVEFVILQSTDHLKMPNTVERCNHIAKWIDEQKKSENTDFLPTEHFQYWPYPADKLDKLYDFLIKNGFIATNPGFKESFRTFFVNGDSRTIWKSQATVLIGLFYKIYGFLPQYNSEPLHRILSKLFLKESGEDFKPKNLNQTLLNNSHKYETGIGISKVTNVIFEFIDSLELPKKPKKG
ncbi:MAG: hypothetical protein ACKOQ6_04215 [Bacteroidota bacterium]